MKRLHVLAIGAFAIYVTGATALATHSAAQIAPETTSASTPAATPGDWSIAGTIEQMNGEFWDVQGFVFRVTDATGVTGDVPAVGGDASATGTVLPDGTWQATAITVGQSASSSPTPTASPTDTATSIPTAVPTDVSTATAVPPTPSALATVGAAPTVRPEHDGDGEIDNGPPSRPAPRIKKPNSAHHGKGKGH